MKAVLALLLAFALVGALAARDLDSEWKSFKSQYSKVYTDDEATRKAIFADHLDFIDTHMAEYAEGKHSYTVAINEWADMAPAEFVATVNGYRSPADRVRNVAALQATIDLSSLPASVDWRQKGIVTPIKNQGQCGSCWSFSATGSTEGQHALVTGSLVSLSEQDLIDCSTSEGNQGCDGGLPDYAFEYIISNGGDDTEKSYPYTATGPNRCRFNKANVGATLKSYKDIASGSESALQQASATIGPISVAIDASHQSFQLYSSGVYYEPACSSTQLDHAVLVVGYGTNSGKDFWLVKNSWGTTWGMQGYIEMSRNRDNNCGIATDASYPIAGQQPATNSGSGSGASSGSGSGSGASSGSGSYSSGSGASSGSASSSGGFFLGKSQ